MYKKQLVMFVTLNFDYYFASMLFKQNEFEKIFFLKIFFVRNLYQTFNP
jgi:hypothetical protein